MSMAQAPYPQSENQAGVAGSGLMERGLAHLTGSTASSAGSHACGDPSGGGTSPWTRSTSHGSVKQEVAHRYCLVEG
jgi:putative transposase